MLSTHLHSNIFWGLLPGHKVNRKLACSITRTSTAQHGSSENTALLFLKIEKNEAAQPWLGSLRKPPVLVATSVSFSFLRAQGFGRFRCNLCCDLSSLVCSRKKKEVVAPAKKSSLIVTFVNSNDLSITAGQFDVFFHNSMVKWISGVSYNVHILKCLHLAGRHQHWETEHHLSGIAPFPFISFVQRLHSLSPRRSSCSPKSLPRTVQFLIMAEHEQLG